MRKLVFVVLAVFLLYEMNHFVSRTVATPAAAGTLAKPSWEYSTDKDPLTDHVSSTACLKSTNEINFGFPYNGGSTGELCFRNRDGKIDSYFQVSKGQMLCHVFGCTVQTRFDDGAVQSHHALGARTDEPNIVFFVDTPAILQRTESSSRLRIATDFYQEGKQTFEFSPEGLDTSKLVASN